MVIVQRVDDRVLMDREGGSGGVIGGWRDRVDWMIDG